MGPRQLLWVMLLLWCVDGDDMRADEILNDISKRHSQVSIEELEETERAAHLVRWRDDKQLQFSVKNSM